MNRQERRQAERKPKSAPAPLVSDANAAAVTKSLWQYEQMFRSCNPMLNIITPVPAIVRMAEAQSSLKCPTRLPPGAVYLKAGTGEPLNCLANTWARMKADPTLSYRLGITIWQNLTSTVMEAHCVIRHPDGRLEDVTSYCDGGKLIAFIPTPFETV